MLAQHYKRQFPKKQKTLKKKTRREGTKIVQIYIFQMNNNRLSHYEYQFLYDIL